MSKANSLTLAKRVLKSIWVLMAMILLASCGFFGASPESETPPETRVPVPTFTATAEVAAPTPTQPPAAPPTETAQPSQPEPAAAAPTNTEVPPTPTTAPATDTPAPKAQVVVTQAQINVRNGPGTEYGLAGSANQNDRFDVLAKNAAGDWWKICCVNGQQVWIFGQLVSAENVANVAVDSNIPAPPVAQQPTQPAAQPTQPPAAQPTNTSAPPPPRSLRSLCWHWWRWLQI